MKRRIRSPFLYAAVIGAGLIAGSAAIIASNSQAAELDFSKMSLDDISSVLSKKIDISKDSVSDSLKTQKLIIKTADASIFEGDETIVDYEKTIGDYYVVKYDSYADTAKGYNKYSENNKATALLNRTYKSSRTHYDDDEFFQAWGVRTMKLDRPVDSRSVMIPDR